MEVNSAILDYLKNKKALINLIISRNDVDFRSNNDVNEKLLIPELGDFDCEEDHKFMEDEIIGSCKFSLNDILTDPDFSNKVFDINSVNNSDINYGFINIDLKLENSASVEGTVNVRNQSQEKVKVQKYDVKYFIHFIQIQYFRK